jgi:hypothetical protein
MAVKFTSGNLKKHAQLVDDILEVLEVENDLIKEKESHSAYLANLPEGISKKNIEDISKYNSKFITAAHIAVGELAADIFMNDPGREVVLAKLGYFAPQDSFEISVSREKTYQNHWGPEGTTEVTKHLVMSTSVAAESLKGYGLKAARDSMSEEFANMFKK